MIRALMFSLGLGLAGGADTTPLPKAVIEQRLNEHVPLELMFRDETGRTVALREYFHGKPVILVLAYYRCPRLCSLVLNNLTEGLSAIDYIIGKDFTVVTVSIDPRETPALAAAKKTAYLDKYARPGADRGWHFLTGEEPAIQRLATAVGFRYTYDPRTEQYAHASGIMILTGTGTLARYFFGLEYAPRDLRFGLEDASAGSIGSPVTRPLRLLCFGYDSATGTYTLLTMRLLRGSGLLMVLLVTVGLVRAWRRQKPAAYAR